MKKLILLSLTLLFSCTSKPPQKSLFSRFPASLGKEEVVTADASFFSEEVRQGDFYQFIREAQTAGLKKFKIEPAQDKIKKIAMTEDTSVAGDFYILIGTNFTEKDEVIRKGDFDDIYAVAKRMSWLKFRVTINLTASITDLKNALANTKPTIITWTSHGNTGAFYDFNVVPVPANIFENASPSVYQFHLASCEGYQAMQAKYLPFIPSTMKHWAWKTLTYHPGTLKPHFAREDWNPYINYPGTFSYKNLVCQKKDSTFVIYDDRKKLSVGEYAYTSEETCNYMIANATDLHVCNKVGEKWEMYNRKNLKIVPGKAFENHYDCLSRLTNVRNNQVCRSFPDTDRFHAVDVESHERSETTFESTWDCYDYVDESKNL